MPPSAQNASGRGAPPVVTLRFETWEPFLQCYAKDLTHGGLFLAHDTPLPVFSPLQVRLVLPDRTPPLLLPATVVHVTAPGGAAGRTAGMGVQLSALPEETARALKDLVRLARRRTGITRGEKSTTRTLPGLPAIGGAGGAEQGLVDPEQILPILREHLSWFSTREPASALGLSEPCDVNAARQVYFKLCKRYHPDLYSRYHHPQVTAVVTALFAAIQNAYFAIATPANKPSAAAGSQPSGPVRRG